VMIASIPRPSVARDRGICGPAAAYLLEDDLPHRGSIVRRRVGAKGRQHFADQPLVTFDGYHRKPAMPKKPVAAVGERRRNIGRRIRYCLDRTSEAQVIDKTSYTCLVVSPNALSLPAPTKAMTPVFAKRHDCLVVDFDEPTPSCFQPSTEVDG
jgi:hypothetical protein